MICRFHMKFRGCIPYFKMSLHAKYYGIAGLGKWSIVESGRVIIECQNVFFFEIISKMNVSFYVLINHLLGFKHLRIGWRVLVIAIKFPGWSFFWWQIFHCVPAGCFFAAWGWWRCCRTKPYEVEIYKWKNPQLCKMAMQPTTALKRKPPRNSRPVRAYLPSVSFHKALFKPLFLTGGDWPVIVERINRMVRHPANSYLFIFFGMTTIL